MPGLRDRFGSGQGLRARFSAAVPVQDEWVEVGIFLVNSRTGERRLNNRSGGLPTLDTPTMAAPVPRQPTLLSVPQPPEQPRSAHGPAAEPTRFVNQDTRYAGIYDRLSGQPREIQGALPTYASMEEDDGLGPVDVSAPSFGERLAADIASNAFGPFIGGAEMLGGWAESTGLDALFPGAQAPYGMREELRQRSDELREKALLADPEGGFGAATGMAAREIATGLPGPSLVLGPLAGKGGAVLARTAGLGRTGQVLAATGAGAAEQGLENFADTVDRPWQERAAAVALGAGLGLAGGIGDIRTAGRAADGPPVGLRKRFAPVLTPEVRTDSRVDVTSPEFLAPPDYRVQRVNDGIEVITPGGGSRFFTKAQDASRWLDAENERLLGEEWPGLVERTESALEPHFSAIDNYYANQDAWRAELEYRTEAQGILREELGREPTRAEIDAEAGRMLDASNMPAAHDIPTGLTTYAPLDKEGVPRFGWREALRQGDSFPPDLDPWIAQKGIDPDELSYREKADLYKEMVAEEKLAHARQFQEEAPPESVLPELTPRRWEELKAMNAERAAAPVLPEPVADGPARPAEVVPSPLATGLWERFQARRPTALTAPFEQRLAAAAYDRGLVRTQEELSGLLDQASRYAPAEPGRVAADAAIRDALEDLRSRPQGSPGAAAPTEATASRFEGAAQPSPPIGKPSEAGFLRLRSEPPPPDTPEGAAMEAFIGDPNLPPMTMAERFDALRHGVESFYTEAVNLDAPVERLGKRKGAPAGMKRTIEQQLQRVRGAGDIAKNMAESRNDVESLWSIWNGADEATYRDWRRIGAAEREMELIERAGAGDEIDIDQNAADAARDYLNNVVPQLRAENQRLDRLITETRRWSRDNIIEPFVDAGILSREQADEIVAKNQAHLPFNRVQRAVEAMAAGTQDEMARAKVHRITAGLSEIDKIREPMESILQRAHHARVIAEQQRTRNVLAEFVEQVPDIFPEIKPAESKALPVAVVDDKTVFRRKVTKTKKTEAFPVWRDGEMQVWEAPSDVLSVVNFMGPHELSGGLKAIHSALSVPGQMMRAGVTSTLEFALYRNPAFDQFEAFINSKSGFVPVLDTLRGLFHVAGKTKLWDDAMRAGAGNSVLVAIDRPETVTRISSVMQEQGLGGSIRSAMDAWRDAVFPTSGKILGIPGEALGRAPGRRGFAPTRIPLTPLQAVSQVMEAPTRMGGYLAAESPMPWNRAVRKVENLLVPESERVGMGPLGPERAMEEFRSNTLDFLRGGRTGKLLNGPEAFLNAEIQGWDKLARNLKHRPGPTLLKALAAFTIPALAHWEMNHDDPDYQREPEWKKMLFFRLPLPNGTSVPIPRGRGLASTVFGYLVEKVLDHAAETDPDAARDVVAALVDNTPAHYAIDVRRTGGVMPSLDLIPTAAEPEVEIATNYDAFRDAPVEPRGKTSLLPADRFSASTSPTLQALSDATPFSPIQLQHLVRGHLGGVGTYATDLADQFVDSDFQELPPDNQLPAPLDWVPTDAPLLKGMVSREPVGFSSRPVQDFYAILERSTQARNSLKEAAETGRDERAAEIIADYPELNWAEDLERIAKDLGAIRKKWNQIRALPEGSATPEEIREWLHGLDVQATELAESALRGVGLMK